MAKLKPEMSRCFGRTHKEHIVESRLKPRHLMSPSILMPESHAKCDTVQMQHGDAQLELILRRTSIIPAARMGDLVLGG